VSLDQLEERFWRCVRSKAVPDSLDTWLMGEPSLNAARRLGIYHHAYYARQIGVLGEVFLRVRAVIGPVEFANVAREYLNFYPSRTPVIERIGGRFPAFLSQTSHGNRKGLTDLARLERARLDALLSPDSARSLSLDELATTPPARTRLLPHPAARLLRLSRRALALWHGAMDTAETGNTYVLVSRPVCEVLQREFDQENGRALERSYAGEPLAEIFGEFSGVDAIEKASRALTNFLRVGAWAGLEVDPC